MRRGGGVEGNAGPVTWSGFCGETVIIRATGNRYVVNPLAGIKPGPPHFLGESMIVGAEQCMPGFTKVWREVVENETRLEEAVKKLDALVCASHTGTENERRVAVTEAEMFLRAFRSAWRS